MYYPCCDNNSPFIVIYTVVRTCISKCKHAYFPLCVMCLFSHNQRSYNATQLL